MRYADGRWAKDRWVRTTGREFSVAGRSAATTATADKAICNLWNPSTTRSLWVLEFSAALQANASALDPLRLCRTSTLGNTPGATVTPDLDNDLEREVTPQTGTTLRLAQFGTDPLPILPALSQIGFPITGAPHSKTWVFPYEGIRVPPGTGLGLFTTGAIAASAHDIYFRFVE